MVELKDLVTYLCANYPGKKNLTKERILYLVFLSDWKSTIQRSVQLTDLIWSYGLYGPNNLRLDEVLNSPPIMQFDVHKRPFSRSTHVFVAPSFTYDNISKDEKEILDFIIKTTANLSQDELTRLVYSTYPLFSMEENDELDLPRLAHEYEEVTKLYA